MIDELEDSGRTVGCCGPVDGAQSTICRGHGQSYGAHIVREKLLDVVADSIEDLICGVLYHGHCVRGFVVVLDQGTIGRADNDIRVPFAAQEKYGLRARHPEGLRSHLAIVVRSRVGCCVLVDEDGVFAASLVKGIEKRDEVVLIAVDMKVQRAAVGCDWVWVDGGDEFDGRIHSVNGVVEGHKSVRIVGVRSTIEVVFIANLNPVDGKR